MTCPRPWLCPCAAGVSLSFSLFLSFIGDNQEHLGRVDRTCIALSFCFYRGRAERKTRKTQRQDSLLYSFTRTIVCAHQPIPLFSITVVPKITKYSPTDRRYRICMSKINSAVPFAFPVKKIAKIGVSNPRFSGYGWNNSRAQAFFSRVILRSI